MRSIPTDVDDLHARDVKRFRLNPPIMKATRITRADVGKYFVADPGLATGRMVSREEFMQMSPSTMGGWEEISIVDVNHWD